MYRLNSDQEVETRTQHGWNAVWLTPRRRALLTAQGSGWRGTLLGKRLPRVGQVFQLKMWRDGMAAAYTVPTYAVVQLLNERMTMPEAAEIMQVNPTPRHEGARNG